MGVLQDRGEKREHALCQVPVGWGELSHTVPLILRPLREAK